MNGALTVLLFLTMTIPVSAELSAIRVSGGRLVDDADRTVRLYGMNVGDKSSERRHKGWQGPDDFHALRRWGMNCIRYMIFWSAVEPAPGQYDEAYLESVDQRIAWARDAGLYVILDMHQDLWGGDVPGANGAPVWATLDDGLPHRTIGGAWSTAYFVSPKIHRAFDNFWNNAPGPGGVGIQDRYAAAWRHIAARYANEPAVIGFDLMNEPFVGSDIRRVAAALWRAVPAIFRGADMPDGFRALLDSLREDPLPSWLLKATDEPARQRAALDAVAPVMEAFERDKLMPMYRRVHRAIREVNQRAIFFLEPAILANAGVPSFIEPLCFPDGTRDPLQAYMPHAYDLVVDTRLAHAPSENRLNTIFEQFRATADRLEMPLLIGEWGAFYGNDKARDAARLIGRLIDEHADGAFYWDYYAGIERVVYFESLARPVPHYIAGTPRSVQFNPETGRFACVWDPVRGKTSVFALPPFWHRPSFRIAVSPNASYVVTETAAGSGLAGFVEVTAGDGSGAATLVISPPR